MILKQSLSWQKSSSDKTVFKSIQALSCCFWQITLVLTILQRGTLTSDGLHNCKEAERPERSCQWLHLNNAFYASCLFFTGQLCQQCVYLFLRRIVTCCASNNDYRCIKTRVGFLMKMVDTVWRPSLFVSVWSSFFIWKRKKNFLPSVHSMLCLLKWPLILLSMNG